MNTAMPPSIEERLSAAAFQILTDDRPHTYQAQVWAVRFLRRAARGHSTAFLRHVMRKVLA